LLALYPSGFSELLRNPINCRVEHRLHDDWLIGEHSTAIGRSRNNPVTGLLELRNNDQSTRRNEQEHVQISY
jgi:hypothetical protein